MSRRSAAAETGTRRNGVGNGAAPPASAGAGTESSESTPLLSRGGSGRGGDDGSGGDDDESPLLGGSDQKHPQRRPSLPALKKLDPYPGNGLGARTMNAAIRGRERLVHAMCCGSRWLNRYRRRWVGGWVKQPKLLPRYLKIGRACASLRGGDGKQIS